MTDEVNHPPHYTQGGIECFDAIRAALTPEEFRGYIKGNVLKYLWRERHKGGDQDLKKARWYLGRYLEDPCDSRGTGPTSSSCSCSSPGVPIYCQGSRASSPTTGTPG